MSLKSLQKESTGGGWQKPSREHQMSMWIPSHETRKTTLSRGSHSIVSVGDVGETWQADWQAASQTSNMILPAVDLVIQTGCLWTSTSERQIARPQRVITTHQDHLAASLGSFVLAPLRQLQRWPFECWSTLLIMFMWHTVVLAVPTHLNLNSFCDEKWLLRQGWGSLSHTSVLVWTVYEDLDLHSSFPRFPVKDLEHLSCKERLRELRLFSSVSESNTLQSGSFRYSTNLGFNI